MQTRDLRPLPFGYGMGSGTIAVRLPPPPLALPSSPSQSPMLAQPRLLTVVPHPYAQAWLTERAQTVYQEGAEEWTDTE